MTFRQKTLWALVYVNTLCGFGLMFGGAAMMPQNLPANALASWLHPGTLTAIAGLVGIALAGLALYLANEEG